MYVGRAATLSRMLGARGSARRAAQHRAPLLRQPRSPDLWRLIASILSLVVPGHGSNRGCLHLGRHCDTDLLPRALPGTCPASLALCRTLPVVAATLQSSQLHFLILESLNRARRCGRFARQSSPCCLLAWSASVQCARTPTSSTSRPTPVLLPYDHPQPASRCSRSPSTSRRPLVPLPVSY